MKNTIKETLECSFQGHNQYIVACPSNNYTHSSICWQTFVGYGTNRYCTVDEIKNIKPSQWNVTYKNRGLIPDIYIYIYIGNQIDILFCLGIQKQMFEILFW
jgi:hypothetical protein